MKLSAGSVTALLFVAVIVIVVATRDSTDDRARKEAAARTEEAVRTAPEREQAAAEAKLAEEAAKVRRAEQAKIDASKAAERRTAAIIDWPTTKVEVARLLADANALHGQREWDEAMAKSLRAAELLSALEGTEIGKSQEHAKLVSQVDSLNDRTRPKQDADRDEAALRARVDVIVDASKIAADYQANSASAASKYEGKRLLVSGVSEGVTTNVDGLHFTALGTWSPIVRAFFLNKYEAAKVKPGVGLRVECMSIGSGVTVDLSGCTVARPKP